LRANALRIDVSAAIDGGVDARDRNVALVVYRDLDDGGDVADETAMRGDAKAVPLRQLAAPFALFRRKLGDAAQSAGVDWI
jgi:hypothetical protein